MNTDSNQQQIYSAAFAEASSELEQISVEIEELSRRRSRVEKAVAILKGQVDGSRSTPIVIVWRKDKRPNLAVETRVRFVGMATKRAN
ncbi:MAG TPA: hypothetical protein VL967_12950 [Terracidiphilus sp.]|nr:hypothetical protein [Terracidiphilus sp.]